MFKVGDKVRVTQEGLAWAKVGLEGRVYKIDNSAEPIHVVFPRFMPFKESELELLSSEGGE